MSGPKRLFITELTEFSLVDKPANPLAMIHLFKRDSKDDDMPESQDKEVSAFVEGLKRFFLGIEAPRPTDSKANGPDPDPGDSPAADVNKEDKDMADTPTPEAVNKADLEALQKRLDEANERIEKAETEAEERGKQLAKMESEKRDANFVKRAEGYKSLPIKADEFGPILRKVADALGDDSEEFKELDRVLSAANESARVAEMTKELGSNSPEGGSVEADVQKLARELREKNPKLSEESARGQVYMSNPELRRRADAEAQAGR